MLSYFWVAIGGALGSLARYLVSGWVARGIGETFPWGTLAVNVSGSLAIGLFAGLTSAEGRWFVPAVGREFFMIGICGGYTTFSSFSLQTLSQLEEGNWFYALANLLLSVTGCLLAVWLGHILATRLNALQGN